MEQIFKDFAEAISPALAQLVVALVGVLVAYATAYVRERWNTEKANMSEMTLLLLEMAARNGVESAQQIYGAVKERNQQKLDHAFDVAQATMKQFGFNIAPEVIYAQIEAIVGLNKSQG